MLIPHLCDFRFQRATVRRLVMVPLVHTSRASGLDFTSTGTFIVYIMATTGVYISLFNIFANLLQLLMALAGEGD